MTREEAIQRLEANRDAFYFPETKEALDMAIEALGYTEWLEKIIVEEEIVRLCEDTPDHEWCEENCRYKSIKADCLRHLYEVSKGGDSE